MRYALALALCLPALAAADFKVGAARVSLTPDGPIWLSGYAGRTHPSNGVLNDIWAKALAVEDAKGERTVIVTTDLIGLPRVISDEAAARLQKERGLDRARLVLNSSHTHTGPVVWPNLGTMYDMTPEQMDVVKRYGRRVAGALVEVAGAALDNLAPAQLAFGQGTVGFAANRRQSTAKGVQIGVNPEGPVDHSVPVLQVKRADGSLMAVLFGYACHNTTLTGEHYKVSGDYAGFAQAELEKAHPNAVALFLELCGGDQNPNPRSQEQHAVQHGKSLAAEVDRTLGGPMKPVRPPVRAAFQLVDLKFKHHTRETFEAELNDENKWKVRRAQEMLKAYDERRPVRSVAYPVQAVRFGSDLTLLALGGEVVVDYSLRTKKEYPGETLIVAGYSNDVMCYIPTVRVLREGGYEANDSMIYYGQPGPFTEEVEETIFKTIHQVMRRVGAKR
ncbi:MAG: neutral/alkaline non-lysosomal ceramidase N-terminal domain-containing protein [Bryobacteraceae bacterium]|nr:neutral/alkaline non-lysosomal ceramidase N-terminal domain-containing protein [Bryobacteraceae bacterium]